MSVILRGGHSREIRKRCGYLYACDLVKIEDTEKRASRRIRESSDDREGRVVMPEKRVVIKFFAPVVHDTINALLNAIDERMKQGTKEFIILISTPGGTVHFGLSAYNYLQGIPAKITTHNFGSVDSIGLVLFCGGEVRYSVPQASFLLHGVSCGFQNESLDEKDLEERLKSVKIDSDNIAKVIAMNSGLGVDEVVKAMFERTSLNADEAKDRGIIHDIKTELFYEGDEVISINYQPDTQPG